MPHSKSKLTHKSKKVGATLGKNRSQSHHSDYSNQKNDKKEPQDLIPMFSHGPRKSNFSPDIDNPPNVVTEESIYRRPIRSNPYIKSIKSPKKDSRGNRVSDEVLDNNESKGSRQFKDNIESKDLNEFKNRSDVILKSKTENSKLL